MKINKDLITEIINLSLTNKQIEISKKLNISQVTVSNILRNNNINTNRNRLNESKLKFNISYFDNIDTKEKAYWLGFIVADGCLKNNKVRLVSKDEEILIKFKKSLESEHKIVKNTTIDKRNNKEYTSYVISITNNLFTKKLQKYINVEKSDNFIIKNIDEKYYLNFIAGMFDGDGSLTIYGKDNNRIKVNLISTKECLEQIQDFLEKNKIITKKTKILKHYSTNRLYLYRDAFNFLNYIYEENLSDIYLNRKYEKFKNFKNEKK
jgi:hypothetical protein